MHNELINNATLLRYSDFPAIISDCLEGKGEII